MLLEKLSKIYKTYNIRKKNGEFRPISHPSKPLKAIQRWLSKSLFSNFPIHESATAYRKGKNIKHNATLHSNTKFTLRIDFRNFFPSFDAQSIYEFILNNSQNSGLELTNEDAVFATFICTKDGFLTIGAPSSPIITNTMMHDFDETLFEFCKINNIIYSRYADDLFFSSSKPNSFVGIIEKIQETIANSPILKLSINHEKTRYLSRRYRRSITGLVLTPTNEISIGRSKKREIRTLVYLFKMDLLSGDEISRLSGILSYTHSIEPEFLSSIERKYGEDAISSLFKKKRQSLK